MSALDPYSGPAYSVDDDPDLWTDDEWEQEAADDRLYGRGVKADFAGADVPRDAAGRWTRDPARAAADDAARVSRMQARIAEMMKDPFAKADPNEPLDPPLDAAEYRRLTAVGDAPSMMRVAQSMLNVDYTAPDGTRMASRVTAVTVRAKAVEVEGTIIERHDTGWSSVGHFERTLRPAEASVSHNLLSVNDRYQGKGFGEAFVEHAEGEYVKAGMREVLVSAGLTGGGYAWARMGFDWNPGDPGDEIPTILDRINGFAHGPDKDVAAEATAMLARFGVDAHATDHLRDALENAADAYAEDPSVENQSVLDSAQEAWEEVAEIEPKRAVQFWPTPYEVSVLGWRTNDSHGPGDNWPGKMVLRGSNWNGRLDLTKRPQLAKVLAPQPGEDRGDFLARVAADRRRELAGLLAGHGNLGDEAVDWSGDGDR